MFNIGENGIDQKIALSRSVLNKWYDHLSWSYAEAWKNIAKLEARKNTIYDPKRWLKPNESWVTKTNSGLIWFLLWCVVVVVLWNSYIHNILRDFWSLASSSFSWFSSLFSSSFDSLMDIFPSTFSLLPKLRFMSLESFIELNMLRKTTHCREWSFVCNFVTFRRFFYKCSKLINRKVASQYA